jgi:hypothetical protein
MKIPFENYDPEGIESAEQEITSLESEIIVSICNLLRVASLRVQGAYTYGDLYKLYAILEGKIKDAEENMHALADKMIVDPKVGTKVLIKEINKMINDLNDV